MGTVTASQSLNANVMCSDAIWKFNLESTFNKAFLLSDMKVFFQNGPICANCRQACLESDYFTQLRESRLVLFMEQAIR